MEQKTEASQAVDERTLFEKAMNDMRSLPRELDFSMTKSPSGRPEYANTHLESCWNGWQARAALTEAAQAAKFPVGRIGAQEFLNWNRRQPIPLVAIPMEMGVYRKAIEIHQELSNSLEFGGIEAQGNTSNNSSSSAQGEDSARLDDLATIRDLDRLGMELGAKLAQMVGHLDNGVEYLPRDAIMIAVTDWRSAWSKNAKARKPINRARASAETGGVKP